jgi:hypothetical protein
VITAVPAATPDKMPEDEPIEAIAVLLLAQLPPDTPSLSGDEAPVQTDRVPVMAEGTGVMVIIFVA